MESLAEGALVSAYILTALSCLVIITRLGLRVLKHEKLTVDDYIMMAAVVFYAVFTATCPGALKNGTNVSLPDTPDPSLTPRTNNGTYTNGTEVSGGNSSNLSPEYISRVVLGSKWILWGRPFYLVYIWLLKLCLLIYYHRITSESKERVAIIVTSVLLAVMFVVSLLASLMDCHPIQLAWQVVPVVPECAKAFASTLVVGSSDILTDLILLAIPIPVLIRKRLPPQKIYDVSLLYAVAAVIIICIIIRMVIVLDTRENFQERQLILAQTECFLSTIAVNAPVIRKLFKHGYDHVRRGRFGSDDCSVAESGMNLTVMPPSDNDTRESMGPSPMNSLRASMTYIRDKVRRSRSPIEIEREVQLLQERKTGKMSVTPATIAAVECFAAIPTQAKAHIKTEISSAGSVHSEASQRRRIREKMRIASHKLKNREHTELSN